MRPALIFAAVLLLAPMLTSARASADAAATAAARRALREAVSAGRSEGLLRVRAQFQALSAAEPGSALLHYWVAVASWRVLPLVDDKKKAEPIARDGLAHCDAALAIDPHFAEALAMKGALQGMSIRFNPASMMTLGPQSEANLSRARDMSLANPRIQFLRGIGTLHKPAAFGGGPAPALEMFKQAQALFAADSAAADSTAPDWGRDDALLWAGRAAMETKDYAAARGYFTAALQANPANAWVRGRLLPAAEEALAGKAKP
ncbi:MAG TPA: hypothetical protein VGK89_13920 [Candidatus Eisenbacteria bacterium]|jgi:tetratricopeptide (TPR) repeat protein